MPIPVKAAGKIRPPDNTIRIVISNEVVATKPRVGATKTQAIPAAKTAKTCSNEVPLSMSGTVNHLPRRRDRTNIRPVKINAPPIIRGKKAEPNCCPGSPRNPNVPLMRAAPPTRVITPIRRSLSCIRVQKGTDLPVDAPPHLFGQTKIGQQGFSLA